MAKKRGPHNNPWKNIKENPKSMVSIAKSTVETARTKAKVKSAQRDAAAAKRAEKGGHVGGLSVRAANAVVKRKPK